MALVTCPECNKQISSTADSCVGCGAPIQSTADIKATGGRLTTTQLTSKRIKLQRLAGLLMFAVGLGMSIVLAESESPSVFWPFLAVLGALLMIYARIKRWWHHD